MTKAAFFCTDANLSRRPRHLTLGEEVDVEMGDGFAGMRAVVHDEAEAFREVELFCNLAGDEQQVSEGGLIGGSGLGHARDQFFRDNEEMNGRLRLDVVQHDAVFVLVLDLCGDLAVDDALEDGFRHGESWNHRGTEVTEDRMTCSVSSVPPWFTKRAVADGRSGGFWRR